MDAITVWLAWTLLSGAPVDVNSFMTEASCKSNITEATEMLKHAKLSGRPDVPDFSFVGCQAVPVVPGAKQDKS